LHCRDEQRRWQESTISDRQVTDILPLGYKDYGLDWQRVDAKRRGWVLNIQPLAGHVVLEFYHPEQYAAITFSAALHAVTAKRRRCPRLGEDNP